MAMRLRNVCGGLMLIAGLLAGPSLASASGEMDGAYFKLTWSSTGIKHNGSGLIGNGTSRGICYTKLVHDGFDAYNADIACETSPGVWALTNERFNLEELGDGVAVGDDDSVEFTNAQGDLIFGYSTSVWKPRLNASGTLVSATGMVLGAEVTSGSIIDGGIDYLGKLTMSAVTVPASRVPAGALSLL